MWINIPQKQIFVEVPTYITPAAHQEPAFIEKEIIANINAKCQLIKIKLTACAASGVLKKELNAYRLIKAETVEDEKNLDLVSMEQ